MGLSTFIYLMRLLVVFCMFNTKMRNTHSLSEPQNQAVTILMLGIVIVDLFRNQSNTILQFVIKQVYSRLFIRLFLYFGQQMGIYTLEFAFLKYCDTLIVYGAPVHAIMLFTYNQFDREQCFLFTIALATGLITDNDVAVAGRNQRGQTLTFRIAVFTVALCYCLVRGVKGNQDSLEANFKKFECGIFELIVEGFNFKDIFACYVQYGNVSGIIRAFLSVEFRLCVYYCCALLLPILAGCGFSTVSPSVLYDKQSKQYLNALNKENNSTNRTVLKLEGLNRRQRARVASPESDTTPPKKGGGRKKISVVITNT